MSQQKVDSQIQLERLREEYLELRKREPEEWVPLLSRLLPAPENRPDSLDKF